MGRDQLDAALSVTTVAAGRLDVGEGSELEISEGLESLGSGGVAQAATYLEHQPGGIGDEGAAPRVRCAALEPELAIKRPNQFTTLLGRSAWPRSDRMTDPCAPCSF